MSWSEGKVAIRRAQEKDIGRIADIWLDTNIKAHSFIPEQYWNGNFELVKEMLPQAELYVYEDETGIQGFIGLDEDYIAGIFVQSEAQSRGIGGQLIAFAKSIKRRLQLSVYQKNVQAAVFYERQGFTILGEHVDEPTGEKEYRMEWKR